MTNKKILRLPVIIAASALLIGCGSEVGGETDGPPGEGGPRPPTPVEVMTAQSDTVVDAITATGQIEAVQFIELRPEVEGRLVEILAREGVEVRLGTPLFRIDDAELRAQVARLEAERDLAAQALARTRGLIESNASSAADLEQAEAAARSSQAQLDLQELRLERTVVRAPFTGIVGRRLVSLGDYLNNATRLTTLQTVDPQWAAFQIPERYAGDVAVGQTISFSVASTSRQYTGEVDFVGPNVTLPARTIAVRARVGNAERDLRPGMFIEVRLVTEVRLDATTIPEDALLPLEGAVFVWVVSDNSAERREVEVGVRSPGYVEILSGVAPGEQVVVGGLERLFPGAPVALTLLERD